MALYGLPSATVSLSVAHIQLTVTVCEPLGNRTALTNRAQHSTNGNKVRHTDAMLGTYPERRACHLEKEITLQGPMCDHTAKPKTLIPIHNHMDSDSDTEGKISLIQK
jgi:hypothetical protein